VRPLSRILVTGSRGLIGSALVRRLHAAGWEVSGFDIANGLDVADAEAVAAAMNGCEGVVHLAAVSRVVWGERDPARCRMVNVIGTRNVLSAASRARRPPWVLAASSREVYGQAVSFPVGEAAELRPLNCYARSKVAAENLVAASKDRGLWASVIRFSSVYGEVTDHADRVAPAFARLAALGGTLRIDGGETTLDFTHVDDVAVALQTAVGMLAAGNGQLPTLLLASGRGTSLPELAEMAIGAAGRGQVRVCPGRSYDVRSFIGDPARAEQVLGWRAGIALEDGIADMVKRFTAMTGT
jgi:nucleoside-diphosphate-sugar epimerase